LQEFNPEENHDPQKPAAGLLRSLNPFAYVIIVLAVIFFLYQFIGGMLALAAGDLDIENPNVKITRIILSFGQFMFILAPTIFFSRFQTANLKELFRLKAPKVSLVLLSIAGIILIQPFLQGYMYMQEMLLNSIPFISDTLRPLREVFESLERSTLKIVTAHSLFEFLVVVFVICITPAICEEVLFRGFALGNITKVARPMAAIFLSGFLFAFYHFQPLNIVPLIILGWYLGFVVFYANSIWVGIICHFLNNFFAAYFLYAYGKEDLGTPNLTGDELTSTIAAGTASALLFASVLILYFRLRVPKNAEGTGV
jgi:uncharacterized protein